MPLAAKCCSTLSMMPPCRPFQPAWTAATHEASSLLISSGRQSAVITAIGRPVRVNTASPRMMPLGSVVLASTTSPVWAWEQKNRLAGSGAPIRENS